MTNASLDSASFTEDALRRECMQSRKQVFRNDSTPMPESFMTDAVGDEAVSREDCSQSLPPSTSLRPQSHPQHRTSSKVDTIRNQKTGGLKNSWHGALATGWMEKEK